MIWTLITNNKKYVLLNYLRTIVVWTSKISFCFTQSQHMEYNTVIFNHDLPGQAYHWLFMWGTNGKGKSRSLIRSKNHIFKLNYLRTIALWILSTLLIVGSLLVHCSAFGNISLLTWLHIQVYCIFHDYIIFANCEPT